MEEKIILDGCKLQWHMDRVERWLKGERIAPITIDCALTNHCNYRCVYCYGKMQRINQDPSLSKETIYNFLDDAAEIGVKAISFVSDGESTCNPHLYDAIIYGKRKNGLDMALGTNGYLLKEEDLEDMLSCLTYLRFNISAGEKERYAYIHGCKEECFDKVKNTIRKCVEIKKSKSLAVTIGLQMVLLPEFQDQIMPLANLGRELDVDYLVIKHCSDDENHTLGVDYSKYVSMENILKEAEKLSTDKYLVAVKWSKILSGGKRNYAHCYGPPFILQLSGSGLVAPCGMLFNDKYSEFHIGNIKEMRFKEIWESERYWEVIQKIASDCFNPNSDCGTLCLQHKVNEFLWDIKQSSIDSIKKDCADINSKEEPIHINFI